MHTPTFDKRMKADDEFCERVEYELELLMDELDAMQIEQVHHIAECAYLDGILDGIRLMDFIYQRIS